MTTKLTFLLCLLLAVACVPTELTPTPQEALAEITIPAARPTQTATLRPETPTPHPTPYPATSTQTSPFFFEEIDPNAPTSTPTLTPTPTPTLISHYDLPAWINDPNAKVFGVIGSDFEEYRNPEEPLNLINVSTGEIFRVPVPEDSREFIWGQDDRGIYFQYSYIYRKQYERVYIASGEIIRFDTASLLFPKGELSPNRQYLAYVSDTLPYKLLIENLANGDIITSTYTFPAENNSNYKKILWSPNNQLIGVSHLVDNGPAFAIFTLAGEVFRQYHNINNIIGWSPTNSDQISYIEGITYDDWWANYSESRPCILDIQTSQTNCLTEINAWHEREGIEIQIPSTWSPDGSQIVFLYAMLYPNGGGVCTIDITTQVIDCPITPEILLTDEYKNYYGDSPANVVRIIWSPDGMYLLLQVDSCGLGCDDGTMTQVATIARDGSDYRLWGIHGWEFGWRPDLNR